MKKIDKTNFDSKKHIKEYRCKCNQCGKIWHYLESDEKRIKKQILTNACGQMQCCLPLQMYSNNERNKWEQECDKLNKCPECGSGDISKEEKYYAKKD